MTSLKPAQLFIDGELRNPVSGKTYDVISPWTDKPVNKEIGRASCRERVSNCV